MQLPVVMVGGGGGRIQGGRILDYRDKPNRQMCRLLYVDDGQDEPTSGKLTPASR